MEVLLADSVEETNLAVRWCWLRWVDWFEELVCVGRGELGSASVRDEGWVDWRWLGGGALHCDVGGRKHGDAEAAKSLGYGKGWEEVVDCFAEAWAFVQWPRFNSRVFDYELIEVDRCIVPVV